MVENTSKDVKQIPFEFREDDSCMWKDVVDGFGDFVEPSWVVGYQYRRKPKPDTLKPNWPKSNMSIRDMYKALSPSATISIYDCDMLADAVIAHALETGLVVLPETVNKFVQIDYKKDAEDWGNALNEAAWTFIMECPEKSGLLFNNTKAPLRAAIAKYLELVEKDAK